MKRALGFSLVELMVAITLALIVTAGVMSVFIGSKSAFQSTSGVAALSDSGRFALNFLDNAVRDAGNMACGAPIRTIFNVGPSSPLNTPAGPAPLLLFQPMTGFEAVNTGAGNAYGTVLTPGGTADWNAPPGWPAGLQAAFTSLASMPIKNNDVLVVRSSTQGGTPAFVTASAGNSLTLVNAAPATWNSQLAIVSDCVKSLVFQISSGGGSNTITHNVGGSPGNLSSTFPATLTFDAGSQVTLLQTTAYYIGVGADGDGALFSADLSPGNSFTSAVAPISPNELVPDIEAMQILYGIDTNQSQTVGQYVTADQVADFTTVMSVEIAVLAAGPIGSAPLPTAARQFTLLGTQVTPPIDTRVRQVFTITIAARNMLP
ncbi:MAG TPA: PilW family protein [Steroidobacteraceae bacterium]